MELIFKKNDTYLISFNQNDYVFNAWKYRSDEWTALTDSILQSILYELEVAKIAIQKRIDTRNRIFNQLHDLNDLASLGDSLNELEFEKEKCTKAIYELNFIRSMLLECPDMEGIMWKIQY